MTLFLVYIAGWQFNSKLEIGDRSGAWKKTEHEHKWLTSATSKSLADVVVATAKYHRCYSCTFGCYIEGLIYT